MINYTTWRNLTVIQKIDSLKDNTCDGDVDFSDIYEIRKKINSSDIEYIEFTKE